MKIPKDVRFLVRFKIDELLKSSGDFFRDADCILKYSLSASIVLTIFHSSSTHTHNFFVFFF